MPTASAAPTPGRKEGVRTDTGTRRPTGSSVHQRCLFGVRVFFTRCGVHAKLGRCLCSLISANEIRQIIHRISAIEPELAGPVVD